MAVNYSEEENIQYIISATERILERMYNLSYPGGFKAPSLNSYKAAMFVKIADRLTSKAVDLDQTEQ